jgi:cytochrome P450
MKELFQRYGNLYYVWLGNTKLYLIAHHELAKEFYVTQSEHAKPDNLALGYPFDELMGECLGVMDGPQWATAHKFISPYFNTARVNDFSKVHLLPLVDQWLREFPGTTFTADVYHTVVKLPLLVMGTAIYGPISRDEFSRLLHLSSLHEEIMDSIFLDITCKLPGYKLLPTQLNRKINTFKIEWNSFNNAYLANAQDGDYVFRQLQQIPEDSLTWTQLTHTLDEILFANVDISGASLAWLLYFLAVYPDIQHMLLQEIRTNVNPYSNAAILEYLAKSDTYMTCVEYEAARLGNVFPFTMPEVTNEPLTVGDYILPAKATVSMDFAAMNRNPEVWEDPDLFNPSRFKTSSKLISSVLRFGFGRIRRCLGQRYARMILRTALVRVLLRYSVHLASPPPPAPTFPPVKRKSFLIPDVQLTFQEHDTDLNV